MYIILHVTEKAGPEKYRQRWGYIKMCLKQSSLAYVSNCHIIYLSLSKGWKDFHKAFSRYGFKGIPHLLPQKAPKLACFVLYLKIDHSFV